METILGNSFAVFIGLTILLFGFIAFMTGQAIGNGWKPPILLVPYGLLLGAANRFLAYALFDGRLLHIPGFIIDSAYIMAIAYAAYRLTTASKMVAQYPWLYERAGPFRWRPKVG